MAEANDPFVTKSMLDEALKGTVDDIASIIRDFSTRVDERFNKVEADIAELKADVANLNTKYDHLITTLDAFLQRLDDQEQENAARDAHLERLDRWMHQVADRLQIELR